MLKSTSRVTDPLWYPCSQMKDYESFPPLAVSGAEGSYIQLENGKRIIDAISSWWCKSLGHGHPKLREALINQANRFEHVILANTTNDIVQKLTSKLCELSPSLNKVFYSCDGSSAIEVAMKMSIHYRHNLQQKERNKFIALKNSYHGESGLCLSASDIGIYRDAYKDILLDVVFLENLPYVSGIHDPAWKNCDVSWKEIEKQLLPYKNSATAIVVEPILQGAGGMNIYSADLLKKLRQWCTENNVHLIADEILSGFGRTGMPLAYQHAGIEPDIACIGKGVTAGWLPMSCVLVTDNIYDAFYDDYENRKSFLHSNTFAGNPLAVSVALATLNCLEEEKIYSRVPILQQQMQKLFTEIANNTGRLTNIRGIGGVIAGDLIVDDHAKRWGYKVYQRAVELGALLRPLGNTIYWLPPLNISEATLLELQAITQQSISDVLL